MILCAALGSGCDYENLPTAAQIAPLIKERDAVAHQYWAATQAFQRAPLGFKVRLAVGAGYFSACGPGGAGGLQYQILADWEPVGLPPARQAGRLQQAVPIIEAAFNDAGWRYFLPSTSTGLDEVTRLGITLSLDTDPSNPAPLERDWIPTESYTVTGPCTPVPAQVAAMLGSSRDDTYGTVPPRCPRSGSRDGELTDHGQTSGTADQFFADLRTPCWG